MTRVGIGAALVAVALLIGGCKSPEEKLIDRRTELRSRLDELYRAYSGAPTTAETTSAPEPDAGVVGRLIASVERGAFDEYCLAIGRGERPFTLSGKLDAFMKVPKNADACRDAARTQLDIDKLEAQVHPR